MSTNRLCALGLVLLCILFAHEAHAAYAFVNQTGFHQTAASTIKTSSYSPSGAANDSLLLVLRTTYSCLPLKGYSGGGTPGDGVNTYNLIGQTWDNSGSGEYTINAPSNGNTTITLNSTDYPGGWTGSTATYIIVLSDGEVRSATMTSGSGTSSSFSALTGSTFTTSALIAVNPNTTVLYQANSVSNTAVTPGASCTGGGAFLTGIALYEYTGIGAGTTGPSLGPVAAGFNWNNQIAVGTGTNGVTTQAIDITNEPVMLFGFAYDTQGSTIAAAGTSPNSFTGRSPLWTGDMAEDVLVSSNGTGNGVATWKATDGYDDVTSLAATFPIASGGGGGTGITVTCKYPPYSQWQYVNSSQALPPSPMCGTLSFQCDATSGNVVLTLPTAVSNYTQYEFVKVDSTGNTCAFGTTSSQTINGSTPATVSTQWNGWNVKSTNAEWIGKQIH
jgi:hypothetical protein